MPGYGAGDIIRALDGLDDPRKALQELSERSCPLHRAIAAFVYGYLSDLESKRYDSNKLLIENDPEGLARAFGYYEVSAKLGLVEAASNVCHRLLKGAGVSKNYSAAREWCEKSAQHGDKYGYLGLGYIFHNGLGVEPDLKKAYKLYLLADGLKSDLYQLSVTSQMGALEQALTYQDINAAQRAASETDVEYASIIPDWQIACFASIKNVAEVARYQDEETYAVWSAWAEEFSTIFFSIDHRKSSSELISHRVNDLLAQVQEGTLDFGAVINSANSCITSYNDVFAPLRKD